MDEYFLSEEDWDTIVELGVGDDKDEENCCGHQVIVDKQVRLT